MSTIEPDTGELLVKALDLAVGGVALARYAATHTADARLRRLFQQFASTSEHQEKQLRQQLAAYGVETSGPGRPGQGRLITYGVLGVASLTALLAGVAVAARLAGTGAGDPASRVLRVAGASVRRLFFGVWQP